MVRQQKRGHTLNLHKVLALVACFVIGYLIWSTVAALAYLGKTDRLVTSTFAELQRASAQTLEQQKAMQYHATRAYVEKVAREDMLMSKKGDTVVLFPVDRTEPNPSVAAPAGLPHLFRQLISWVKGWF